MRYLIIIAIFFSSTAAADQFSVQESTRLNDTELYYISKDRRAQYNFGEDEYWFVQCRRAGMCPKYCGFNYDMFGFGFGKYDGKFFAQAGIYYVTNTLGHVDYDENLRYYLNYRFNRLDNLLQFKSYEVKNDKITFGITLGFDHKLTDRFGIKFSYQYIKVKEVITGYFTDPPQFPYLWWDPVNRDLSTVSFGFYVNF